MNAKPTEKKRYRTLYARRVESYQADRVGVFVDFDRLNHPKSPIWSPRENVGPLLVMLIVSISVMVMINLVLGTAIMVTGVFLYLFLINSY